MGKQQAAKKKTRTAAKAPPPLFPLVERPPEYFELTTAQYRDLEKAGDITLSSEQREKLLSLAYLWIEDLRFRLSPRPKAFRDWLQRVIDAFSNAEDACRRDDLLKRHILYWAMATDVEDAEVVVRELHGLEEGLKRTRDLFAAVKEKLPNDPGGKRPFDDERYVITLADVFEAAGGKPVVYAGGYYEQGSMANTPFRRFAQLFYFFLRAREKRDPGGLDDAIRDALAVRRENRLQSL
jgi:hypothetical protein